MRYNLRSPDRETLEVALKAAGLIDQYANPAKNITLDVIGTIYVATGEMVEVEGFIAPVMAPIPGWHANLIAHLTDEQEALIPIIPPPKNPYRVFAGE